MQSSSEVLRESSSFISSGHPQDSPLSLPQSRNLSHLKQQVEVNYRRSVANQIYSFPLQLEYCASLVSSDESSLETIEQYNLNDQNNKYEDLENDFQSKKIENTKTKLQIQHKKQRKKNHIRNQSALMKKKYKDLISLMNKSMSPQKRKSSKLVKNKQNLYKHTFGYQKDIFLNNEKDGKEQRARNKSHRLKTQPDESFKSTFRKPVGQFRFGNIKYPNA